MREPFRPLHLLAVAAFVALMHVAWGFGGSSGVTEGSLVSGDSYMRLVRVTQLYQTGEWFETVIAGTNAPFGATLHWTRQMDVLLLALAAPLTPLLGFTKALFWAAALVSPFLHVLCALAMAWAVRPLVGRGGACIAGALTATQFGVLVYAGVGYADHNMLYALYAVLAVGCVLRVLAAPKEGGGVAMSAGALLAGGLWVGVESYVVLALCLAAFACPWLMREEGEWRRRNIDLAFGLSLGLTLALLIERGPSRLLDVEFDRISIVHLTMAALLLAFWGLAGMWERTAPWLRIAVTASAAAIAAGILHMLYPGVLLGPLAVFDPSVETYLVAVAEHFPMTGVPQFLLLLGSAVFALPWAVRRSVKHRGWLFLAVTLAVYLAMAVSWVRWSPYAGIFLAVALADVVIAARRAIKLPLVRVLVVVLLIMGPAMVGIAWTTAAKTNGNGGGVACDARALTEHLKGVQPVTILASPDFGPEILYKTGHPVVMTLFHRNSAGMLDGVTILGGGDEAESLRRVRKRAIGLIVLCPGSVSDSLFLRQGGRSLYKRLEEGDAPTWLRETASQGNLRLFKVD